jgi:hypothetical protein
MATSCAGIGPAAIFEPACIGTEASGTGAGKAAVTASARPFTPGTFAKVRGVLRKAKTKSTLVQHRWHDPAGQSKTRRWNSSFYQHTPSLKDVERRHETASAKQHHLDLRKLKVPSLRQRLLREYGLALVRKAQRLLTKPDAALLRGEALPTDHALRRFLTSQPVPTDLEGLCVRLSTLAKHTA